MLGLPKTCLHCGVNFMKRNPKDENEKMCNSCQNREKQKKGTKEMEMEANKVKIEITIELDHPDFSKLEEMCNNKGMSFSEYFIDLHKTDAIFMRAKESTPEIQEQPSKKKIKS